jgi:hypothetical protein
LATAGTLGAIGGAGATAFFRDDESVRNELVAGALDIEACVDAGQGCEPVSDGQVDLPIDLDGAGRGSAKIEVTLPEGEGNNPGYVWFRTNCPKGRCGLEQALDVTVRRDEDCDGETDVGEQLLARDSLCEVLKQFGSGRLLQGSPLQPGERVCLRISWSLADELCEDDTVNVTLEFFAHQARHTDGPQRPWTRVCNVDCKTAEECTCDGGPAISFVAFCVPDGTALSPDDLSFTWYADGQGDPVSIEWDSDVELSTVVLYHGSTNGPVFENFEGGTSGTAIVGEGTPGQPEQTPPSPAPEGETGLKYEYDEATGAFDLESEDEPLVTAIPSTPGVDSTHQVRIPIDGTLDGRSLDAFAVEYGAEFDLSGVTQTGATVGGTVASVTTVTAEATELHVEFDGSTTLTDGAELVVEYDPVQHPAGGGQYDVEAKLTAGGEETTVAGTVMVG